MNNDLSRKMALSLFFCAFLFTALFTPIAGAEEVPQVKAVVVRGNEHIDTALIQSAITKTQLDAPAAEESIVDDMHAIYELGFFYDVSANLEPAPGGVRVVFSVDENPVVQDIIFKGATVAPVDQFKERMRIQPGDVLNYNYITEDVRKLPDWVLSEHGIAIMPTDVSADDDGFVTIEIAETRIKEIRIEGNEKTQDFVIERELSLKPGDILDLNELNSSMRRILMLGFFDEIGRDFEDGDNPNETIITINVTERKTGTGSAAVGYSTQDGIIGVLDISEENFLGRAQRVNAYLELGGRHRVIELGFFEPYIDEDGTSFGINLYNRRSSVGRTLEEGEFPGLGEDRLTGNRTTWGGDLSLGRRFSDNTRGEVSLKAQNNYYDIDEEFLDQGLKHDDLYENYNTRTVGLGLFTNTTDHPFYPTEGFKNNVNLEIGTTLFGGETGFSKLQMEHSRFFEVREGGYVFAVRGKGGRVLTGELKENEQFRIGGSDTLRGYQRGDDDLSGDKMFMMNAEFRFPIVERVQGVVFSDWGRAWEEEENMDLMELKNSYGLGVRLDTPLGLMRFDYGWGLDEEDNRKGSFIFGLGQTF